MPVTMNDVERRNYEKRPFKAYDKDGNPVYFKHLVDMRQGMEMHGLTVNPPNEPQPESGSPFKNYEEKSAEDIRLLCIARNVFDYQRMEKAEQVAALRVLDKRDEDARRAGLALVANKPAAQAEAAPAPEGETKNKPKNKPAA